MRAELQRKRLEASRHAPGQRHVTGKEKHAVRPKSFSSSNAGVHARASRDEEQQQAEERTEEKTRSVALLRLQGYQGDGYESRHSTI